MGLQVGLLVILAWSLEVTLAQTGLASPILYECNKTGIHLVAKADPWGTGLQLNPQGLRLGTCFASSENPRQGLFHFQYSFKECGFARLTSGKMVEYSSDLVYQPQSSPGGFYAYPFSERINCTDYQAQRWIPGQVGLVTGQLSASSGLFFTGTIMNDDFSAPSDSSVFFLGSQIHIEFAVKSFLHRTLRVFVDECVATATPELRASPRNYTVVANHGCLMDSRVAESTFLPRRSPDVIQLSLQAFEFVGVDSDIYLHCQVLVWDPDILTDPTRKACSYRRDSNRWENLDDPSSSVCLCCDSQCQGVPSRLRRQLRGSPEEAGPLQSNTVVRRLVIRKPAENASSGQRDSNSSLAVWGHQGKMLGLSRSNSIGVSWDLVLPRHLESFYAEQAFDSTAGGFSAAWLWSNGCSSWSGGEYKLMPPNVCVLLEVLPLAMLYLGVCFYNSHHRGLHCLHHRGTGTRGLVTADEGFRCTNVDVE